MDYPYRRVIQQAGWWSRDSDTLSRRGRDRMHGSY